MRREQSCGDQVRGKLSEGLLADGPKRCVGFFSSTLFDVLQEIGVKCVVDAENVKFHFSYSKARYMGKTIKYIFSLQN